jgi:hypothetical protein
MFTRESHDVPIDSIDKNARAIQQLSDGPFMFTTVMSIEFVSAYFTTFTYLPQLNVNTGEQVGDDEFQACVMNRFYVTLRDFYDVEVISLP